MSSEHYIPMLLSCRPDEALQWFLALYGILLHRVTVLAAVNLLLTILDCVTSEPILALGTSLCREIEIMAEDPWFLR